MKPLAWRVALAVLACLVSAGVLQLGPAQAAPSITLTVDQSHLFVTAEPGRGQEAPVHVTYEGPSPAELLWEVRDFETLPDGSLYFPPSREGLPTASEWIAVGAPRYPLVPGLRTTLPIRVSPAPGTPPGEYAALLLLYLDQQVGEGIWLRPQLGVRVYAAVPGDVLRAGALGPLSGPFISDLEPMVLSTRLRNTGTVHVDGAGVVRGRPGTLGSFTLGVEATSEDSVQAVYVLPGEARDITLKWTPPAYGLYHLAYDAVDPDIVEGPESLVVVLPLRLGVAAALGTAGLLLVVHSFSTRPVRRRIITALGGIEPPASPS